VGSPGESPTWPPDGWAPYNAVVMGGVVEHIGPAGMLSRPCRVGRHFEDQCHLVAFAPPAAPNGDETSGRPPGHGDDYLLAAFDTTN
jgi:hypothetical protein